MGITRGNHGAHRRAKAFKRGVHYRIRKVRMDSLKGSTNEDLHSEVRRLRTEIQQLREIVNALFSAVFEDPDEEFDTTPRGDENNQMYN